MNTNPKDNITFDDTVFAIETDENGKRVVHIFGYGYCADDGTETDCRFVEYTFFYVPLDEVLAKGLGEVEDEYGPDVKQYITDCSFEKMMEIYHHYDNGQCPVQITAITADLPDGCYVLVSEEVE